MSYLTRVTALSDLNLGSSCTRMTDIGMRHLAALKSLTKFCMISCHKVSDEGVGFLSHLAALENLSITCCNITGIGLRHLTCLTSLYLDSCSCITDEGANCLGNIVALRDLKLSWCHKLTDVGVEHLTSLRSLTRITLSSCQKITDKSAMYLGLLEALRDIDLAYCVRMTDGGMEQLALLTSLTKLCLFTCLGNYRQGCELFGGFDCLEGPRFGRLFANNQCAPIGIIDIADQAQFVWMYKYQRQKWEIFGAICGLKAPQFDGLCRVNWSSLDKFHISDNA